LATLGGSPEAREVPPAIDIVADRGVLFLLRAVSVPDVDVLFDAHRRFSVGAAISIFAACSAFDRLLDGRAR
jgi:L-alanine-DL-glutamate epimerase-like enolase superfamily enzyme